MSCADEDGVPNASGSFFLDRLGFLVNRKRARFQLFARATRPGKLARVGSQDLRAQPEKPEERGVTQSSPPAGRHLPHTAARRGNRASFHRPFTRKGACTERRLARPVRLARKVRPSAKGELAETGSRKKRIYAEKMGVASRGHGEQAPLLANRGGDASASASDSETPRGGGRSSRSGGGGGVTAVCFSVSMIFAGFIVLVIGAFSTSIYGFITGAFVDGVTAGATYHPSTEQVTIQDRAEVVAVTMAGKSSEDYEDLDDLSHSPKTPLDAQMEGEGFSRGYREHYHLQDKDHQQYTGSATPWKGDTGGEGGAE